MSTDRDNPKWTAYVLGELDASERAALESELESSEEAREFVQELRLAASMMKDGLAAHADVTLTPEQRFSIQGASSVRPAKPWFARPLAWTGGLAAAVLLAAISIPSLLRSRQVPTQPLVNSAAVQQSDKTLSETSSPPPVSAFQEDIQKYARTDKQVYRPAAKDRAAAAEALTPSSVGVGFGAGVGAPAVPANETIAGVVTDATSAVLPGVTVKAFNLQTGATATGLTNETGKYELKNLAEGEYKVTAELPGFQTGVIDAVKKEDRAGPQGQQQQGRPGQQRQQAS